MMYIMKMRHKTQFINELELLRLLSKNVEFTDQIAQELEIEVDGGDSAGAFVRDTFERMADERALDTARRNYESARERLGCASHQTDVD